MASPSNTRKRDSRQRRRSESTPSKRDRGRTPISTTPVTTRSRVPVSQAARSSIEQDVKRVLAPFGTRIERASIRFEDVNGPKGGVDSLCRIKVVISGGASLIVEEQAASLGEAASLAIRHIGKEMRRRAGKDGGRTPAATVPSLERPPTVRRPKLAKQNSDGLIGKSARRSAASLGEALQRPEKEQRDAYVDTAAPGISATNRKAGGPHSARRNSKRDTSGMTYALEDSRTQPSRKSTRASGNRTKAATQLARRAKRRTHSPRARALRALAAAK